jgi:hypothetical protein
MWHSGSEGYRIPAPIGVAHQRGVVSKRDHAEKGIALGDFGILLGSRPVRHTMYENQWHRVPLLLFRAIYHHGIARTSSSSLLKNRSP